MTGDPTNDDLLAEAVEWRMRIDAAPGDEKLRTALETWLAASEARREAYSDVELMTTVARDLPADYADRRGKLAESLPSRRRAGLSLSRIRVAGFAAVALAACLAFLFVPMARLWIAADYRTGTAELRSVTLDDGSVVALDAGSAIAVRYAAARREVVLLDGRAYFDVVPVPARPFVVVANDVTVTVTGTAFDVSASADSTAVAVRSGTVEVSSDHGRRPPAVLTRGERVVIGRAAGRVEKSAILPTDVAAWREHRLVVEGATMAEVLDELRRHYDGLVVLTNRGFAERRVSGVFDLRRPVEALEAAVRTHDGSVTRITPYVVVVSGP